MIPEPLARPVRRVVLRVRAQRAIEGLATLAIAGLGCAAIALATVKLGLLTDPEAEALIAIALAVPAFGALAGLLRPVSPLVAARLLDRAHATEGRIAAAWELARASVSAPWAAAALGDALRIAPSLRAARAVPLRAPRDLPPLVALGIAVAFLGTLEIPRLVEVPPRRGLVPLAIHDDDLAAFRERVVDVLDRSEVASEVREQVEAFNRLLEDLADRRIDRAETLHRLAEIEARIAARPPSDAALLRDELRAMGQELRRAELARDLGAALAELDPAAAARLMRELAERLRSERPGRQELERLRRALEEAARERSRRDEAELAGHEQETRRLLRRREEGGASEEERAHLLEQRRRELERLRREHEQRAEARRRLERLRRELEAAARDLAGGRDLQERAHESLERAAEDLNRMARQELTEEQLRDLARHVEALRELIARQRRHEAGEPQGGDDAGGERGRAPGPMDRFVLRARGQGSEDSGLPIAVPDGSAEGAQDSGGAQGGERRAGAVAQGGGAGGAHGRGAENGEGRGGEQPMLVVGRGGNALLEMPGLGRRSGELGGGGSGDSSAPYGGAGSDHAPGALGDPTHLDSTRRTVQVSGELRRGPTRSEVIRSAAQRGFASRDYRNVYAEYAEHAEEVIERDRIPPGYRFYVRRYFQLIRPRSGAETTE